MSLKKISKSKTNSNEKLAFTNDSIIIPVIQESNEKKLLGVISNETLSSSEKLEEVKKLVNLGTDLTFDNYEHLFKAFENNEKNLVYFILEKVDNQKEALGYSLAKASRYNEVDLISSLIVSFEVDVNFSNSLALKNATLSGNLTSVLLLLNNGANIHADNDQALINSTNAEVTKYLLKKGSNINAQNGAAIIEAVKRRHYYYVNENSLPILQNLVNNGANVSAQDNKAIKLAAENWDLEVIELLLPKINLLITQDSVLDNIKIAKSLLGRFYVFFKGLEPRCFYYHEYYKSFFDSIGAMDYLKDFKTQTPLSLIKDLFESITSLVMVKTPIRGRGKSYALFLDFFKGFTKNLLLIPDDYETLKNIEDKVFYWVESYYDESMLSGSEYLYNLSNLNLISEEEVFKKLLLTKAFIA